MNTQHLSNLQLELLKLYSTNLEQGDIIEIKRMVAHYFARKANLKRTLNRLQPDYFSDNSK